MDEQTKKYDAYKIEYNNMINDIYGNGYGRLINMLNEQTKINEGLIKTYPSNDVVKSLNKIGIEDVSIEDGDNITSEHIIVNLPINKYKWYYDKIIRHMNMCGWFESTKNNNGNKYVIVFDAKFDKEITDFVYSKCGGILYHSTPSIYVDKIYKYGLMPKTYLKLTDHPERVYFTTIERSARDLIPLLYNTMQNELYKKLINKYTILKIDLNKLNSFNSKPKFYLDPNYKLAVYTHESINPNCIDIITEFNI